MCGSTAQQNQIENTQQQFYGTLTNEYSTVFGENQAILGALTSSFQPILQAGINQQGFSPAELANLNAQAVTGTGVNYAQASKALGAQQGAEGGGTLSIPTGAKNQQQEELATSAAENESGLESNILASDYATGRQNYLDAAQGLAGVAAQDNPTGFAGAATGAGGAAASTANQIAQENNSWMQLVGGALGAAAGPLVGAAGTVASETGSGNIGW
jgi:hypothetical protein